MHQMNSQFLSRFPILSILTLFLFLQFPISLTNPDPDEASYSSCNTTYSCGSIAGVGYPFRGYQEPEFCGYPGFVLNCGSKNFTTLDINNITFRVLEINPSAQTMNIAREDVIEATCPQRLVNTTLDNSLFEYSSGYMNLTFLYGCPAPIMLIPGIDSVTTCNVTGYTGVYIVPGTMGGLGCDVSVTVPVSNLVGTINSAALEGAVEGGFGVKWKMDTSECSGCTGSGGRCGYSPLSYKTTCYCPNQPNVSVPKTSGSDYEQYTSCSQPFQCSNIPNLGYPFWGGNRPAYCGHQNFELDCQSQAPQITISSIPYRVLSIDNPKHTLTVARAEFWNNPCPSPTHLHVNATLDTAHFDYSNDSQDMTIYYGCTVFPGVTLPNLFSCITDGITTASYFVITGAGEMPDFAGCSGSVVVHVNQAVAQGLMSALPSINITEVLDSGFGLRWDADDTICSGCVQSGGVCGSGSGYAFACLCRDQAYPVACDSTPGGSGMCSSNLILTC
ncbi:hypothetical protein RHGRI_028779 [Rhododendron griersonianum]|uniref:non-specific serine/threonine protein kinase n=1 Tax=Rhododendron griersonianum TaxID=479676 RepID=A0AAV6IHC3_9ERIC|nr:hypothetical protein RHGRI_028779 [Rhododendron griersonianum]